jgi:hypothetical protein
MLRFEVELSRATPTIDDFERRNPLSATTMTDLRHAVERAALDASASL